VSKEVYFFGREDSERISKVVPYVEGLQQRGKAHAIRENMPTSEIVYAKLTEKTPKGQEGYWKAAEVRYDNNDWEEVDGGRQWDEDEYTHIRHYSWDDAEIGQIVKARLIVNIDTGLEEWVFDTDVTNPEGLVFYADDNGGTGQARKDSQWTTKVGAKVLTNVGTAEIQSGFQMGAGDSAQVVITFIDVGDGYELVSAVMTNGQGQYWTEANGKIVVNWRIAEVEQLGDMGRLKQYHSGDIHLEIFSYGSDEDEDDDYPNSPPGVPNQVNKPVIVEGDNKWIQVIKAGRKYTVSHINAGAGELWKTLTVDKTGGGSYTIKVDNRGHIISVDEGGGAGEETPTQDYDVITSTLTSNLVGSDIRPELVGGEGISVDYKILNNGANYLDWIQVRTCNITVINDAGDHIHFDVFNIAQAGMPAFNSELLENNAGTSGRNETELFMSTEKFRFNGTVTVRCAVAGKDVTQIKTHNTATCTATNTINSIVARDKDDPNAAAMTLTTTYSLANLESGYQTRLSIELPDGTPVPFSLTGQNGDYLVGVQTLTLDATSATEEQEIWFDFESMGDDKPSSGDTIQLCTELRSLAGDYDANVKACTTLNYRNENDAVVDQYGNIVSDQDSNSPITQTDPALLCRSDSFDASSLNTTRWNSTAGSQVTQSGGTLFMTATDSNPEWVQEVKQTGFSASGDFTIKVDVNSSKSDGSDGFANQLRATVGGTEYGVAHYKNGGTLGYYYLAGGSWTYGSVSTGTDITGVEFEISRVGSTITLKAAGNTLNSPTESGNVTTVALTCSNNGGAASGNPEVDFDNFIFEAPTGTPYCT